MTLLLNLYVTAVMTLALAGCSGEPPAPIVGTAGTKDKCEEASTQAGSSFWVGFGTYKDDECKVEDLDSKITKKAKEEPELKSAQLGSSELIEAVNDCNATNENASREEWVNGRFYDRAFEVVDNLKEACTDVPLYTKMKCTKEAAIAHLGEDLSADFIANLDAMPYGTGKEEYQVDQCMYCPKGSTLTPCLIVDPQENKKIPPTRDLIKMTFVKELEEGFDVKVEVLPENI